MGARGPQKTPTEVLKERSSWLAKTRGKEPEIDVGVPPMPQWLSAKAKKHWPEICQEIEKLNVMSDSDGIGIGMLVDALCHYIEANKKWNHKNTEQYKEMPDGSFKSHPSFNNVDKAAARLLRMISHFGLTPSSRAGLQVIKPQNKGKELSMVNFGNIAK